VRALTHALEQMRHELEERHALETFVADLSHELKNPVAAIRASAEVLTEGAADEPETARRFALRIRESADKLQQLTQDLLSLAGQAAAGGGGGQVRVAADAQGVTATVRDEGTGVDPAIRERLFERFSTTRHGEGGTGLGLAIVRAVAELHGGTASLRESGPQGSVFSLTLPRA